jgi:hypothetical protein
MLVIAFIDSFGHQLVCWHCCRRVSIHTTYCAFTTLTLPFFSTSLSGPEFNDVMLGMLVKLSTPSRAPLVKLNRVPDVPADNAPVTVIGFGNTEWDGIPSSVFLETSVNEIGFDQCNAYYGSINDDIMVCAGIPSGARDSCQEGDSGGTLFDESTGLQVGVVSFGDGCGLRSSKYTSGLR